MKCPQGGAGLWLGGTWASRPPLAPAPAVSHIPLHHPGGVVRDAD